MSKTKVKELSFELNEDMLNLIAKEFDAKEVTHRFVEEIAEKDLGKASEEVFGNYGNKLAHRVLQLGDEYSDRTYELILETIDKTGAYKFPLLPQRFLEIAYLSTQDIYAFPVHINSTSLLRFEINDCKIFKTLEAQCPMEALKDVPCKVACMNLIRTIFRHFDFGINLETKIEPLDNNRCMFSIIKG